jgi:hypothetical protein
MKQIEVMLQFFLGVTDKSEVYCDDIRLIALRNLTSLGGFWFDLITSIPWSYFDLDALWVRRPLTCSTLLFQSIFANFVVWIGNL